ncbi:ABC transporter permease [Conexibacter woesei]|uniref:Binding-protein-dependent transport systems inner membrane component n=1 Tax=Conexibacter woesei (strain DSM 14684 / CCUG 47730 / CIP 108061 / JCM 11494 / NBRC 100937 / ID131577) TaxID=469383 RepID=D3F5I6_CONWI|nr:ABC transporter permease [Conexibacter woesei]ADB50653.1 binding-protein-dependent transport systems inner membrane component [Conexibacter woesei DSM 14684]
MAVTAPDPAPALSLAPVAPRRSRARRWTRSIAAWILALAVLTAIFAPLLAPYDPAQQSLDQLQAPSAEHLLGTDALGRDVLSRIIFALRTDLVLVAFAAGLPMLIGTLIGAVAAYRGGVLDAAVRWVADVFQALPVYVLLIALVFVLGPGAASLIVSFSLLGWIVYARLIRTEVRRVREREYVSASYLLGLSRPAVLLRHVLPNSLHQSFVYLATDLGMALQGIAVLSFFGLGVKAGTPELGAMVAEGQLFLRGHWWLAAFPGLAIVILGSSFAALGDRLNAGTEADR